MVNNRDNHSKVCKKSVVQMDKVSKEYSFLARTKGDENEYSLLTLSI